jgi:hypothetical protein
MSPTGADRHADVSRAVDELIGRVLEQLRTIRSLRGNWDGYGADPPSTEVLDYGARFLDVFLRRAAEINSGRTAFPLYVSPARDGGLFVQIVLAPIDLEIEIKPDLSVGFLRTNTATGEQVEGERNLDELFELVA